MSARKARESFCSWNATHDRFSIVLSLDGCSRFWLVGAGKAVLPKPFSAATQQYAADASLSTQHAAPAAATAAAPKPAGARLSVSAAVSAAVSGSGSGSDVCSDSVFSEIQGEGERDSIHLERCAWQRCAEAGNATPRQDPPRCASFRDGRRAELS